jgi:hydrocephalus-inducing protein
MCRNVSKLPLHFTLKAVHPFGITPAALELQPGDASSVCVSFDPNYRDDQTSHTAKQRCLISYPDNPQKDWLDLTGLMEFPNVVFDTQSIDFGCVLMDSMKRMAIHITNPGTRPVSYSWSWVTQAFEEDAGEGSKHYHGAITMAPASTHVMPAA